MSGSELKDKTNEIFSPGGIIAGSLPGFEPRESQKDMSLAVAAALTDRSAPGPVSGRKLAVEAGTGIGKTLAYLVPAVLSGSKIVVSTGTLNLQEQILEKEIPFIRNHIAPELTALCVKGRQNYLCLYRWYQMGGAAKLPFFRDDELEMIETWLQETETGDRAELAGLADDSPLWKELSVPTTQCLGSSCPESSRCFVNRLRQKAGRSQLLIVNHHLFFSDLALRRFGFAEVLPRYEVVIFDEAHRLETIATRYFGVSMSLYQINELVKDVEKMLGTGFQDEKSGETGREARNLAWEAEQLKNVFPEDLGRFPLQPLLEKIDSAGQETGTAEHQPSWREISESFEDKLARLVINLDRLAMAEESWALLHRRGQELLTSFRHIIRKQDSSYIYWYERKEKTVSLAASPIEIASELEDSLYNQVRATIFTSATLTTGGSFAYFFERLGLDENTDALQLPSPFDYENRTRLYLPADNFPEPSAPDFFYHLCREVRQILELSRGRALILCTSVKSMQGLYNFLKEYIDFPLYMQGQAPKQVLLARFRENRNSVLLAVASFWEGVNVPGESLSCVIIDKLPFEVPSDPVIMARINKIREEGGNPFMEFQIPRAILTLRQGLGRLMRSSSDSGLLAIMDIRLFSKRYGSIFRKSLAPSPVIRSFEEIENFYRTPGM